MAVTKGHGNPNWTRDEVLLALDLYLDCVPRIPSPADPQVIELSTVLRSIPFHAVAARTDSFRNPDGVAFKFQNLNQVATGRGLSNVSRIDRKVLAEFGAGRARVRVAADLIRAALKLDVGAVDELEDRHVFAEDEILTWLHSYRERDPALRSRFIGFRLKKGALQCEMCARKSSEFPDDLWSAAFEVHHVVPLSAGAGRYTSLKDLSLLWAICHRLLHRLIASRKRWFSVEDATAELKAAQEPRYRQAIPSTE
jgi:5-methylcytosine-specific restriction protein A